MAKHRILAINPGSTSTKIAVFENRKSILVKSIAHSNGELVQFKNVSEQFDFRKEQILKVLESEGIELNTLDVIVGRGGLVRPVESGIYEVNDAMKRDLMESPFGEHASNLGGLIADDIARSIGNNVKAYIADPVVVDELEDVVRITGIKDVKRVSIFHALNQKAVARNYAENTGREYEDLNLIVAHLGGGVSIGTHRKGRVIDVNDALGGEGPFSPERAGSLPVKNVIDMCFSGKYTKEQMKRLSVGEGGLTSLLGSNNAREADDRIEAGDKWAKDVIDALSYQIGKSIGAGAAVLGGKVDAIIITGGMAHSKFIIDYLRPMVEFIAPMVIMPGEDEMSALAMNGFLVLEGKLAPKKY